MTGKQLKEALHRGDRVYGTCLVASSPQWPDVVRKLGLDFVFIDTEHITIDRYQLSWMCQTYRAMGIAPVVRIPSPDPYEACKALDAGAEGLIGPYIESAEEVKRLVGATKHRPLKGKMLDTLIAGERNKDPAVLDYLSSFNENSVLIVNTESCPAIEALDEILSVDGLDAVLIGPHDLSISVGVPEQYDHPKFDAAVREIFRKARAQGIGAGIHWWTGWQRLVAWIDAGANFIINSGDRFAFEQRIGEEINQIKAAVGDAKPGVEEDDSVPI